MNVIEQFRERELAKAAKIVLNIKVLREVCEQTKPGDDDPIGELARQVLPQLCCIVEAAQFLLDHDRLGFPGTRLLAAAMEAFANVELVDASKIELSKEAIACLSQ